jgi:hypothetical protein
MVRRPRLPDPPAKSRIVCRKQWPKRLKKPQATFVRISRPRCRCPTRCLFILNLPIPSVVSLSLSSAGALDPSVACTGNLQRNNQLWPRLWGGWHELGHTWGDSPNGGRRRGLWDRHAKQRRVDGWAGTQRRFRPGAGLAARGSTVEMSHVQPFSGLGSSRGILQAAVAIQDRWGLDGVQFQIVTPSQLGWGGIVAIGLWLLQDDPVTLPGQAFRGLISICRWIWISADISFRKFNPIFVSTSSLFPIFLVNVCRI